MSEIASVPPEGEIALLLDYDAVWAVGLQPHHHGFSYMRHLFVYYRALERLGLPADVISPDADLGSYKLVIVPTAFLATERLARSLTAFAHAGGTVVLGVRSGFKTSSNQVTDRPLPGLFRELVGVTVSDWGSLPPGVSYDLDATVPDLVGPATVWAEALMPALSDSQSRDADLQVLAHYTAGPFSSRAALVARQVGAGRALYLGWYPSDPQAEALLAYLASGAGIVPLAPVPEGLIACRRGSHLILLNFTDRPLTAAVQGQTLLVGPRDVQVVKTHPL